GYSVTVRKKDGTEGTYSLNADRTFARNNFLGISGYVDQRVSSWHASNAQGPNEIWYTTTDGEAANYYASTSVTGTEFDEIIAPNANNGLGIIRFKGPVKATDSYAFGSSGNDKLLRVELPITVEKIKEYSFFNCPNLASVGFKTNLKQINPGSFYNCGITSLNLPSGLETIGGSAFSQCSKLKTVRIPDTVTSLGWYRDDYPLMNPFRGCKSLESFTGKFATPDGRALVVDDQLLSFATGGYDGLTYVVPDNVKNIMCQAFENATFGGVVLPEGLETIYDYAFTWCTNLKEVTIPANVETICFKAFYQCYSMEKIVILKADKLIKAMASDDSQLDEDGLGIFTETNDCPIYVPENAINWYTYGPCWEAYGSKLTSSRYRVAQNTNEIWYTVVDNASNSQAMNVTDWSSWSGWKSTVYDQARGVWIASFNSPVTSIPIEAFDIYPSRSYLKSISLPGTVKTIREYAFKNCENLESIDFGSTQYDLIGYEAFAGCGLVSVAIPGTGRLGRGAFEYNHSLTSVTLLGEFGEMDSENPFMYCENLVSFSGSNSMISEGGKCLIKDGVLRAYAGAADPNVTYRVPDYVTSIGAQAFMGAQIRELWMQDGLTSIGWAAFANCSNLVEIVIPASVTSISSHVINGCSNLWYVVMEGANAPQIAEDSFDNSSELFYKIHIPGMGAKTYTVSSNTNWYALRDRIVYRQAENEIWFHLVGGEGTWPALGGSDFGANLLASDRVNLYFNSDKNNIEPHLWFPDSVYNTDGPIIVYPFDGDVTKIPANAFSSSVWGSKLDWMSLPLFVSEIGNGAFKGCSNLLRFPIAFNGLTNHWITSIGNDAFNGCSSMYVYTDPNYTDSYYTFTRLNSIGDRAFKECSSLNYFELQNYNPLSLGKSAFYGCTSMTHANLSSVTELKDSTFYNCTNLTAVKFVNNRRLERISSNAFCHATSLTTVGSQTSDNVVDLPGLTYLGRDAFYQASNLKNFVLPELQTIGQQALALTGMTTLTAPKLRVIGNAAIARNYLTSLDLPSIEQIGNSALQYSYRLKELKIGPNLNSISVSFPLLLNNNANSPTGLKLYLSSDTPFNDLYESLVYFAGRRIDMEAIYVPSGSVNAYKTAWPDYANVIQASPAN
ncbi:MAG: leucine-rich repeat protein, partial [Bacteroidales bacterium]|nr:leucine-rich repeat protein [Bacteroidales bacterium]